MNTDTPLLRARRLAGLTQTQLAEASGVMQCAISRIERGGKASIDTAAALAKALGISELEILYPDRYESRREQAA